MSFVDHDVLVAFADDHVNLHRDEAQRHRRRVNDLRQRLEQHIKGNPEFALVKMLHAGSVAKGTALSNVSDMDVAVYVREGSEPTAAKDLVPWMVERLREAFPDLKDKIRADTHCACIQLTRSLTVDVVPVLYGGDPDDRGFLIDKSDGDRMLTSIPMHLEFIRKRKEAVPDHYAQVVRFIKWWARCLKAEDKTFKCKSFMIELVVAYLVDQGSDLTEYPEALMTVFGYIVRSGLEDRIWFPDYYRSSALPKADQGPIEIFDPVNAENNVAVRYALADRTRLVAAADDAVSAIAEAQRAITRDRAVSCWQRVLGPTFGGAS